LVEKVLSLRIESFLPFIMARIYFAPLKQCLLLDFLQELIRLHRLSLASASASA
jgi:hypothetical protein